MVSDEDDSKKMSRTGKRGRESKKRKNSVGWGGGLYKVVKIRETGFDITI